MISGNVIPITSRPGARHEHPTHSRFLAMRVHPLRGLRVRAAGVTVPGPAIPPVAEGPRP